MGRPCGAIDEDKCQERQQGNVFGVAYIHLVQDVPHKSGDAVDGAVLKVAPIFALKLLGVGGGRVVADRVLHSFEGVRNGISTIRRSLRKSRDGCGHALAG